MMERCLHRKTKPTTNANDKPKPKPNQTKAKNKAKKNKNKIKNKKEKRKSAIVHGGRCWASERKTKCRLAAAAHGELRALVLCGAKERAGPALSVHNGDA